MNDKQSQPAVFLDRDGTIIDDRGHLSSIDDVRFFPETFPALTRLQNSGYLLFIVTHQAGVAWGEISHDDVDRINNHVVGKLTEQGITISEVYVCPHDRSENCDCIKPKTHFLNQASQDYNVDLKRSFSVGDHPHDVDLAINAGGHGIFVLTGHGEKHRHELAEDTIVVNNIAQAVDVILDNTNH